MYVLKKLIRAVTFYKRNKITSEQLKDNSNVIQDMLITQNHWKTAKSVNIYESIFKEVSTHELIHIANQNKEVYYPEEDIELQFLRCDLNDFSSLKSFVSQVKDQFGNIDVFICNAGGMPDKREVTRSYDGIFASQVVAHYFLIRS